MNKLSGYMMVTHLVNVEIKLDLVIKEAICLISIYLVMGSMS